MLQKVFEIVTFICTIPLFILHTLVDLKENIFMLSDKHRDRLFMKRFRLIDNQHVNDFMKWRDAYEAARVIEKKTSLCKRAKKR